MNDTITTNSEPFAILEAGTFHRRGEPVTITESDLDRAVVNFEARRADVPVDYDHSFQQGRGSQAAGWIEGLFRQGSKLLARVKWTARAREQIAAGEYRYVSAEFNTVGPDEFGGRHGFTVQAAGLTNRPFLRGLGGVCFGEIPEAPDRPDLERLLAEQQARVDSGDYHHEAEAHELAILRHLEANPQATYEQAAHATWKEQNR